MVHITRLELSNFKSFGGTTSIPVLPGFTVVSGPNGSGKSNILDALLFCLGISTSKGMRAERLPDLVNHNQSRSRGTVEASVTVTFDLGDSFGLIDTPDAPATATPDESPVEGEPSLEPEEPESVAPESPSNNGNGATPSEPSAAETLAATADREWSITRRLRVTKGGTYTSTYYMNGESCTLTELHEQINRLRIYPEGYNVVLQGDVTAIISMNGKERREIIDELAGVAAFDRKIVQAKTKLDEVKEREDRCRIVENELRVQLERLSKDRTKAEQYKKLRAELHEKEQLAAVLEWRQLKQQEWKLREQIEGGDRQVTQLGDQITSISGEIQQASTHLEELNNRVKALGEEELIALQSTLATQDAEHRQLQNRKEEQSANRQQT
ncbi:MAG TPA: AAA family ATPase, partial [Vampirovibrionales bacterium]